MSSPEIIEAKRNLYHLLLIALQSGNKPTEEEIDLAYLLARDKDIQEILKKARR